MKSLFGILLYRSTFIIKEENWLEYVKSVTRNERKRFRMGHPIPSVPFIYICSSP